MSQQLIAFLVAGFGASLQEIFYWLGLREKLAAPKYAKLIKSPSYWAITVVAIAASAAGTTIWYFGQTSAPKDLLLAGAAFPSLFKHAVAALGKRRVMGAAPPHTGFADALRAYFQIGND